MENSVLAWCTDNHNKDNVIRICVALLASYWEANNKIHWDIHPWAAQLWQWVSASIGLCSIGRMYWQVKQACV
jgi:hypothetical protein